MVKKMMSQSDKEKPFSQKCRRSSCHVHVEAKPKGPTGRTKNLSR